MFEVLKKTIQEVHDRGFPSGDAEFKNAISGRFHRLPTPEDTLFCSQLVAKTYMNMGLLSDNMPTNSYIPVDFK